MKLRIAELREARGLSQAKLGEMVGLSDASISRIETGDQVKTSARFERIAQALGVSVVELFVTDEADVKRAELMRLVASIDPAHHEAAARALRGFLDD